jgi:hypothetical protein
MLRRIGGVSVMIAGLLPLALVALLAAPARAFDVEQLTCVPSNCYIAGAPLLTGDGNRVLFRSSCDLEPGRNPGGNEQVFLLDLTNQELQQVTPKRLWWAHRKRLDCYYQVTSDRTGERIVTVADCMRSEPKSVRYQLFEFRTARGRLRRLGPPVPCRTAAALSGDGRHLAVSSECNPGRVTSGNGLRFHNRNKLYFQHTARKKFKRYLTRYTQ